MSETRLDFSRSLYSEEGVRAATQAWAEVARFSVSVTGDEIIVTVNATSGDLEALRDEFCNHALFETISRRQDDAAEADG